LKILLLGKNGQLGWELERALAPLGPAAAPRREELKLEDFAAVRRRIRDLRPEVIVNAAAYTAVDRAESEPEKAQAINTRLPAMLAEECAALKALLIHYSTDYVFDGGKGAPYVETDLPQPLNTYGMSKLRGEEAVQEVGGRYLIFRSAWVYSLRRDNFVSKVLQWARQQETLRIVDDQVSSPTWARMLAEATALVLGGGRDIVSEHRGLYHLAGEGFASRYAWAQEILRLDPKAPEQLARQLLPAKTEDFPAPARRPEFSALDCTKFKRTFGLALPDWKQSLGLAMEQ
jgi:dTDP-4-dehydrorhamnose reductase